MDHEQSPNDHRQAQRERAVADALRTLIRDFIRSEFGVLPGERQELDLTLRARVRPNRDGPWALEFTPALTEQLAEQCGEESSEWGVYQDGYVHCFRCRSSHCAHATPPSPLMVFRGYDATGMPRWTELTQHLIDSKDERIDRLFSEPPGLVAGYTPGSELKMEQLSSFGRSSRAYAVLGQVSAGYFLLDAGHDGPKSRTDRMALSLQLVETRSPEGGFALRLNRIGCLPGGATLGELFASDWNAWLGRALQQTDEAVRALEQRARAARERHDPKAISRVMGRAPALLRHLASSLERGQRQGRRRTQHAEARRRERRPVHMAIADTRAASASDYFFDERTNALVVCGPSGRVHVFARDGRHITSFMGNAGTSDFRLRTGRWVSLGDTEREALRERLQR